MALEISIGDWVWTSDGKELGRVKMIEESAFLVDAPLAFDYWLEKAIVASVAAERIDLSVSESNLGGYKMDRPNDHNGFQEPAPSSIQPGSVRDRNLLR